MNINANMFKYNKQLIDFNTGYIFKGKNYRCNYIRYATLYNNPAPGTEEVQFYNFQPKKETKASALILHGLGSNNIKFLLWLGPSLANAGVNTSILILPGNYTRVENNSTSGRSFLYPDIKLMYQFWEHAVIDVQSTIDLLDQEGLWLDNNIVLGYCLGGMISTIVGALDDRIKHLLFMTTGGHIPSILHQSPSTNFARRLFNDGLEPEFRLNEKDFLYELYKNELSHVKDMSLDELLKSNIHPLFKIDPVSYAHFIDKDKITFIDAYFDSTLPLISRKTLYEEMEGANRKVLPISHINWLPFAYFLAKYILHKVNINEKKSKKALLTKQTIENPLDNGR